MRRTIALFGLAALLFAACANETKPEAAQPSRVGVRAANYKFVAPTTVKAGAVRISLTNAGPEPHQAQLFRLNAGATPQQVITAAKTSDLNVYKLGAFAGGSNAVDAGESQVSTVNLTAGNYVFMCLLPDPKGRAHASLGMVKALTVTENAEPAEMPAGTYQTASAKEFSFQLPTSWSGTISFTNTGKQPHEFQIMEIKKGKTEQDFLKAFQGPPGAGPPPFETGGGAAAVAPGGSQTFNANLKPGTYFMMCFVTDPVKKAPHFALGMLKKFVVK